MKNRLVELLYCVGRDYDAYVEECHESGISPMEDFDEFAADYLIQKGVIVPPCKVGDYVHFKGLEIPWKVSTIHLYAEGNPQISITSGSGKVTSTMSFFEFQSFCCVLAREEAEAALAARSAE